MRKTENLLGALMLCLLCSGCVNHIRVEEDASEKTIVFHTSMSVSQSPMRSIAESVSKMVVVDYQNGVEMQKIEQTSANDHFGKISMPLKYGKHELLFVGHSAEKSTLSYPTITFEKPTDTFSFYQSLTVDETTESTKDVQLSRSVGLIKLTANDAIPAEVALLRITMSKYYPALNIKAETADGEPTAVTREFEYKTAHIGVKGSTYSIYTFVPTDGFTTDITIATIDAKGGVIHSSVAKNVAVDKNCQTKISGNVFQSGIVVNITINTQWKDYINVAI